MSWISDMPSVVSLKKLIKQQSMKEENLDTLKQKIHQEWQLKFDGTMTFVLADQMTPCIMYCSENMNRLHS